MTEITADERIDKIVDKCLGELEDSLEHRTTEHGSPFDVKNVGEALKALAEGIDAYKKATAKPEIINIPKR